MAVDDTSLQGKQRVGHPLKIHTCTREVDVTIDLELQGLLLADEPLDFELWIHLQLLEANTYNAI
jgi:hypothetical protein